MEPRGRVLVIAGSDSGGGAGIQADVKTITALGGYASTVVTALTAQSTLGVFGIAAVDPAFVEMQMEVVLDDIGTDAVKTGMLHSRWTIEAVVRKLRSLSRSIPVVVDPVLVSGRGAALLDVEGRNALVKHLLPAATVLTPNTPEAAALTGIEVDSLDGMSHAADRLLLMGAEAVLIKGGHLPGDTVVDLLRTADGLERRFESARIPGPPKHGTGCTLASAIAVGLAEGMTLEGAVQKAREYVLEAIRTAPGYGSGSGVLNHVHPIELIDSLLAYPRDPNESSPAEATDSGSLRYDDVIQDGRLRLESAWRPTGRVLWGNLEVARVYRSMDKGTTNVLSRVTLQASEVALEPRAPVRTRVSHRFEHTIGKDGDVDRLLLSTWVTMEGRGPDGTFRAASRAYGQRVFTRIDAPPGQHLVTRLDGFGETGVPPHRVTWEPAMALLELPPGVVPLDPVPRLDPQAVIFGLSHTDLNQHVNFLMYHRAIEQAALARAVELRAGARLASREVALGYRKPSFAGETVRIVLRAFRRADGASEEAPFFGVLAAVVDEDGGPTERPRFADFPSPRVVAQMLLRA